MLQAKTKVAPIKPILTIPKLELNGALLLAKLTTKVLKALKLNNVDQYMYTDSTDVLFWLSDHPSKWPMFIGNRCSQIHTLLPNATWGHIRTHENPADCASRGIPVNQLLSFDLWWKGPSCIINRKSNSSVNCNVHIASLQEDLSLVECRSIKRQKDLKDIWELVDRYSNLYTLVRITAYILRFIEKILIRIDSPRLKKSRLFVNSWFKIIHPPTLLVVGISVAEKNRAKNTWIYLLQRKFFKVEIDLIEKGKPLFKSSSLLKLDPILIDGLLRVGGRLYNSNLNYDQKHPYILRYQCRFNDLLINSIHIATLHGGIKLTLTTLRQEYWMINGRNVVKKIINRCFRCLRYRAQTVNQKMGNLPAPRVNKPSKPFQCSGVDYAGPYEILKSKGRGSKTYKGYICVFVCMSTKAVHLELVSGYSCQDFIDAFIRFTSVRGYCSALYSDQGTTFVGADNELKRMYLESSDYIRELVGCLVNKGTEWHFNPPGAPHFGGIWEAAVKSVKHHIRRVVNSQHLTFEEFYTLLKQVEACLNSRPLLPIRDDPTDNLYLTPSILLTQSDSYIVPQPNYLDITITPLERHKRVRQMFQDFWRQWSLEYLQTLQEKYKWNTTQSEIKKDDLVFITDESMPPARWPLARVLKVFTGSDGLVRVASLRTSTSIIQRPVHKLIFLLGLKNES